MEMHKKRKGILRFPTKPAYSAAASDAMVNAVCPAILKHMRCTFLPELYHGIHVTARKKRKDIFSLRTRPAYTAAASDAMVNAVCPVILKHRICTFRIGS